MQVYNRCRQAESVPDAKGWGVQGRIIKFALNLSTYCIYFYFTFIFAETSILLFFIILFLENIGYSHTELQEGKLAYNLNYYSYYLFLMSIDIFQT